MKFPYQGYPVRGVGSSFQQLVYRPTVPLRVVGPGGEALVDALVDTGADDTLLPAALAGPLGVTFRPGMRARLAGLGGSAVTADDAAVDLELRRPRSVYRWSAVVGFYAGPKAILGHAGGLEHFAATFHHRLRRVTLRPSGPLPAPGVPGP